MDGMVLFATKEFARMIATFKVNAIMAHVYVITDGLVMCAT